MTIFDECSHDWVFHIDSDSSWWQQNKPWQSFYRCKSCNKVITLSEKCILEQTTSLREWLKIQNSNTKVGMIANVISTWLLLIALWALLFWDKLL